MAWSARMPETEPPAAPPPTATSPQTGPSFSKERTERSHVASIGKSLHIKGELSGSEDLSIEGTVVGKIMLNGYTVTIAQTGQVTAEIQAKTVIVGGEMRGDITADGRVEVAASGNMFGDVRAPRVVLADGAHFNGTVDMEATSARSAPSESRAGVAR